MVERRKSRQIQLGRIAIGGDAPVSVQSMTTTKTADIDATLQQIASLVNVLSSTATLQRAIGRR
jgi:(E)-4-hydroxy-3-methylbut-2-enyl-diphosphate synthase